MSEKILSVLMSIYNDEKYLEETLNSIFNAISEKNRNLVEFIFINDGSIDRTYDILEEYHKMYDFILIHQDNIGLSKTQKNMCKLAKGKYIYNVGHDDLLEPQAIDKIIAYLLQNDKVDMMSFDYYIFKEKDMQQKKLYIGGIDSVTVLSGQEVVVKLWRNNQYTIPEWNKVVSRQLLLDNNVFSGDDSLIDMETTPLIYYLSKKTGYLNKALYNYRDHKNSLSHSSRAKHIIAVACRLHTMETLRRLIEVKKDVLPKFKKTLYQELSTYWWDVFSYIEMDGCFNEVAIQTLEKNIDLINYSVKWNRKYIYRFFVKFLGIKNFYKLRYGK